MNKPSPAQQVIADVASDAAVIRLRAKQHEFDARLKSTKEAIDDALRILTAHTQPRQPMTVSADGALPEFDLDTLVRPTGNIESLRDEIRRKRSEESELAEALHVVRRMLRQRETAAFYEGFERHLIPEQVRLGGRSIDCMLDGAELMLEEQALRAPLRTVSHFETADVWAVHTFPIAMIRERLERLQKRGYTPPAEQLRRLEAIERGERE